MVDVFELAASLQKTPQSHSGRYYGFLSGSITNVSDDQGLVRVKARVGAQGDTEESDWLIPAFPGSVECKPSKGDPCIVGFIDGDPNRGFWLYHPESTTKNRPSEFMLLGTTMTGMFNFLVDQFNQLRTDFANHGHAAGTLANGGGAVTGVCAAAGAIAGTLLAGTVPLIPGQATTSKAGNKGNASDGSAVSNVSSSSTVLSGLCKVK